jgi:hypothetical protein
VAVGASEGLTSTVSNGIVSAIRETRHGEWIQISAPISPGSSGGPVLNSAGDAIGVSVAQFTEGQNLNFAIPASDIRAMLGSPPGRIAFPNRTSEAAPVAQIAGSSVPASSDHKSMMQSIPPDAIDKVTDTQFQIEFFGCYGNESGGAIVCVTDFWDPDLRHRVELYRAGLYDAVGRGTTRVYIRFQTPFAPNGTLRLSVEVGGPFKKRQHAFPATQIQTIRASVAEQKRFLAFLERDPSSGGSKPKRC